MTMSEDIAIGLLKKHAKTGKDFLAVYRHSRVVQQVALDIASEIPEADEGLIRFGALIHDIGRLKDQSLKHGIVGGEILRSEGYEILARICERHIGTGISREEIIENKLDLPANDYLPETVEEKIIAYADNLVSGEKIITIFEAIARFREKLGFDYGLRVIEQHNEIERMRGGDGFI